MQTKTQALQSALELCVREMCGMCRAKYGIICVGGCDTWKVAQAALAMPMRNCDVGTVDEHNRRFIGFCTDHFVPDEDGGRCDNCPLTKRIGWSCQFEWAQMPYAQEGAGNERERNNL